MGTVSVRRAASHDAEVGLQEGALHSLAADQ